jgi:glycosyltransferase involved in cell wall biosynthesis
VEEKGIVSIVVPAFNEEARIKQALEEIKKVDFGAEGFGREIIVVNDGSTDKTLEIIKGVSGVRVVSYAKNRGKGFALRSGFAVARGSVIAVQDADLEYPAGNLRLLLRELLRGQDVVYGSRFKGNPSGMSFTFYFGNVLLSLLTSLLFRRRITDMETCQKLFWRRLLDKIELRANGFDIEPELTAKFLKRGFKIKEVPIPYKARRKKEKKISVADGIKAAFVLLWVRLFG